MPTDTQDYLSLFLHDTPLMDVRAPIEFLKGAFPTAQNLPLMNDAERHQVGICYKEQGQTAAIALGTKLVSGATKQARLEAWEAYIRRHPEGYLYCFRGGLRSQITQQWLAAEGLPYPRVLGGYKALRQFLLEQLELACQECHFIILGGLTGSGKTAILNQLPNSLDLEHHANHRGSSFGKHVSQQPAQIDFENALTIDLLKKRHQGQNTFIVEDESHLIGSCSLPISLRLRMAAAPVVWLEDSLEHRITRIKQDYVIDLCAEFTQAYGAEQGFALYADRLLQSLDKIRKRLGAARHQTLREHMQAALATQAKTGSTDTHKTWIHALLSEYYDPMYQHQKQRKHALQLCNGEHHAVLHYLGHTAR